MSGGMDSTLAAYMMRDEGYEIIGLHFNYEQRTQTKELEAFNAICKELNVIDPYIVNLDFFSDIGASALTDKSIEVPINGVEDRNMRWSPPVQRNLITSDFARAGYVSRLSFRSIAL